MGEYQSKYTGSQIDALLGKVTPIESNVQSLINNDLTNKDVLKKISQDEDGNLLYDGNEIKSSGTGSSSSVISSIEIADYEEYSTSEQIIGKWVDGRPLYRKVIQSTTTEEGLAYTFSDSVNVINVYGYLIVKTNNNHQFFNVFSETSYAQIYYENARNSIKYRINVSTWLDCTAYIIIEYTKTTDAENSFSIDMLSAYKIDDTVTDEQLKEVFS